MIMTLYKPGAKSSLRYYTIHDRQPLLTARYALTVAWRVGNGQEREKIYGFETRADMDKKIQQVFRRKIRDGYALLYSFVREHVSEPPLDGPLLSIAR
jgi:predicted DNA-binding WGR domain protein